MDYFLRLTALTLLLTLKWIDLNAQCNWPAPVIVPDHSVLCTHGNDIPAQGNCFKSCENSTVTYTIQPISGASYSWNVIGGSMVLINPYTISVFWDSAGLGIVHVSQTINGCNIASEKCVSIIEIPEAAIQSYPAHNNGNLNVCLGQSVLFYGSGTSGLNQQPALDYYWEFPASVSGGAPTTSVDQNTSFSFQQPGIYNVYLTVTNECGCENVSVLTVNVSGDPSPLISCKTPVCPGETKTYTANITCLPDSGQYIWSIDPPSAGVILTPQNSQSITVKWSLNIAGPVFLNFQGLNCTSGCTSVSSIEIPVSSAGLIIQGDQLVCNDQKPCIYSVAQIPGSVFTWTVNNGTILSGMGTNRIEVQWNSCSSAVCIGSVVCEQNNSFFAECGLGISTISVVIKPSLQITAPLTSVCPDDTLVFSTNTNPSWSVTWKLFNDTDSLILSSQGTGSQFSFNAYSIPGLTSGNYRLHATSPYYCNEADYFFNLKNAPDTPELTSGALFICPGSPEIYTAGPISDTQDLLWNFTGADPSHFTGDTAMVQWQQFPPYSVTYRVRDQLTGCFSKSEVLTVNEKITTTLGDYAIEGCVNSLTTYTFPNDGIEEMTLDMPGNLSGSIVSQDINDSLISMQIQWNNQPVSGRIDVYTKTCGRNNTAFQINYIVNSGDTFSIISDTSVCPGVPLNIVLSNADSNDVVSYTFGDGTPSTIPVAYQNGTQYTYYQTSSQQGYNISAILIKSNGCRSEASRVIHVLPFPSIIVSYGGDLCTQSPPVTATILPVAGHTYLWRENGNIVGTTSTIVTQPNTTLQAVITNTVTGCSSTEDLIIPDCQHNCPPLFNVEAMVSIDNISNENCGKVNVSVTINGTGWTRFSVDFGNGSVTAYQSNSGTNPSVFNYTTEYISAGPHRITVLIEGPNNTCIVQPFFLSVPVFTHYKLEQSCPLPDSANYQYRFLAEIQSVTGYSISNYNWNVKDANGADIFTSSSTSSTSGWTSALSEGYYNTRLTLTVNTGLQCYADFITHAEFAPVPGITAPVSACNTDVVLFDGDAGLSYTTAHWDFGDFSAFDPLFPGQDIDARRTYLSGIYTATFSGTDQFGCQYSQQYPISIEHNRIEGIVTASQTIICPGEYVFLQVVDMAIPQNIIAYNWNTGYTDPWIFIDTTGSYHVVVTQDNGCTKVLNSSKIYVRKVPEPVIIGKSIICSGETATFQCVPFIDNPVYTWNTSNLTIINQQNNEILISGSGSNSGLLTVTIADQFCTPNTSHFPVQVAPIPPQPGLQLNPTTGCEGRGTLVEANVSGGLSQYNLNWSNGDEGNPIFVDQAGPVRATITDKITGCSSYRQILLNKLPDLSWVLSGCFDRCANSSSGLSAPFIIPGSSSGITYQNWRWEVIFNNSSPVYPIYGSGPVAALNSNVYYQGTGVYTIRLFALSANGCARLSDPLTLTVRECNCDFSLSNLWTNCLFDDVNGIETTSFSVQVNGFNAGLNGSFTIAPVTSNASGCAITNVPNLMQSGFFIEGLVSYKNNGLPITYKIIFNADNPLYSCEELITFNWQGCLATSCSDYVTVDALDCVGYDAFYNVVYDLDFDIVAPGGTYNLVVQTSYGQISNLPPVVTLPANLNCQFIDDYPVVSSPLTLYVYLIDVSVRSACMFTPVTVNRPLCPDNEHLKTGNPLIQLRKELNLTITPNPAADQVVFGYSGVEGNARLYISTISGSILQTFDIGIESGFLKMNPDKYEPGVYLISIIDASGQRTVRRFVKF